jgi:hypothetical protein
MSNPNVFAVLIPCDDNNLARAAFRLPENAHGYCKAAEGSAQGIAEEPTIDSREPTPAPGPSPEQANYYSADRILLRLDKPPKDPTRGWQFGTDPRFCDYLLGHRGTNGISSRQFCITITQSFWVELYDQSRYGTCVGHDGQAKHVVVKDDKRLLSYGPGAKQWEEVIIYAPDAKRLAFKIEFPNHHVGRDEYWRKLQAFVDDSRRALPSVDGLGLDSNPPTAPISRQSRTPRKLPIYLDDEEIGHGEFASVIRVIDARDGQVYATKKFKPPLWTQNDNKKRKLEQEDWLKGIRNEYTIMKNNPHVSPTPLLFHDLGLIV